MNYAHFIGLCAPSTPSFPITDYINISVKVLNGSATIELVSSHYKTYEYHYWGSPVTGSLVFKHNLVSENTNKIGRWIEFDGILPTTAELNYLKTYPSLPQICKESLGVH